MFVNLHSLPSGQAMYTLFLTPEFKGKETELEEVDVIARANASRVEVWTAFLEGEHASLYDLDELQLAGISNQSSGYWVFIHEDARVLL